MYISLLLNAFIFSDCFSLVNVLDNHVLTWFVVLTMSISYSIDLETSETDFRSLNTSFDASSITDSTANSSVSSTHTNDSLTGVTRVRLKARRSGPTVTPPPIVHTPVRTPDRLSQLRQEEYIATFREQAHEREFAAALSLSRSWDNLNITSTFDEIPTNQNGSGAAVCTDATIGDGLNRRKRCASLSCGGEYHLQPLYIHVASSTTSSPSQSPNVVNGMWPQKQCFSPSLQAPVSPIRATMVSSVKRRRADSAEMPVRKRLSLLVCGESHLTSSSIGTQPTTDVSMTMASSPSFTSSVTTSMMEVEDSNSLFKSPT